MTADGAQGSEFSRLRQLAATTPASRNRHLDFLRAFSIGVVVVGHWLMAAPALERDTLTLSDLLALAPWTQWATWALQVMPLFFVVGGYANGASWNAAVRRGDTYGTWLSVRLRRLLGPLTPLLVVWTLVLAAALTSGRVRPDVLRVAAHAAVIPTWFLAVYVVIVAAVPITHAAWRRFGLASLWTPALLAALVDAAAFGADQGWLRWGNHALIWPALHQAGYAWRDQRLGGTPSALALATGALALLAALVWLAGYPVSMVTVPGESLSNSRPPTLALLALGFLQTGLARAIEAPSRRWLAHERPWLGTLLVNRWIMTLYLWHATALVIAIGIAHALGGIGLRTAPASAEWWMLRPVWLLALAVLMLALLGLFGRFEHGDTGPRRAPSAFRSVAGALAVCVGLATLSLLGPLGGEAGEPGALGLGLALAGCVLALARPRATPRRTPSS